VLVERLFNIVFLVLFLSLLVALPWHLLRKQRIMGRVLFHLPTPRSHKVSLGFFIVIWIAVILFHIVFVINSGWETSSKLWPLLGLTLPLFSATSVNRFEIRAAGINSQGKFTKWKDLNAFQWKEEGDYKLGLGKEAYILGLIKSGDKFPWWIEWDKFQRCQRESVDKLLSQYLPKAT
jgi:hypothetical protein